MADEVKQLPAPETPRDDWLIPVLVFFGMFAIVLLIVLGNSRTDAHADTLTLADKGTSALPASVEFVEPADGAEVGTTFTVSFGATNLIVEAAGEVRTGAGHFHVLVNELFVEPGQIIPKDETHLHFGTGALSAPVTLEPGTYTLRLQFADGAHVALQGDEYRDEITVTVVE
jgi:hypothetical protein